MLSEFALKLAIGPPLCFHLSCRSSHLLIPKSTRKNALDPGLVLGALGCICFFSKSSPRDLLPHLLRHGAKCKLSSHNLGLRHLLLDVRHLLLYVRHLSNPLDLLLKRCVSTLLVAVAGTIVPLTEYFLNLQCWNVLVLPQFVGILSLVRQPNTHKVLQILQRGWLGYTFDHLKLIGV
jgi:hypothetical protein